MYLLNRLLAIAGVLCLTIHTPIEAGVKGNRSGGAGNRAAQSRPVRATSRPSSSHLGRPRPAGSATPGSTSRRPSVSLPSMSRPAVSRPSLSRPAIGSPSNSRPRPSVPGGGLKPGGGFPTTLPSTRPGIDLPSLGRPQTRPGGQQPPQQRPSFQRPTTRPGSTRPDYNRPVSPSRPSFPGLGPGGSAAGRPSIAVPGWTRPGRPETGSRPGVARPSPGDLGDFLGINRPVTLPSRPGDMRPGGDPPSRPNFVRPGRPGLDRPTAGRPGRPAGNRPSGAGRPQLPGGTINIGEINLGNTVINQRPSWVNINNSRVNSIHQRWQNQLGGMYGWSGRHPGRLARWNRWGNGVRTHWSHYHHHHRWFTRDWWYSHRHGICGWHYAYRYRYHSWSYWWTVPTFATTARWFTWQAPANVWSQPIYYDYGKGGNVVYQNNSVYIDGAQVASAGDFAESAAVLATVPPPETEAQAVAVEWLALGTFAVTSDEQDTDPSRVLQLAVSKEGIISGTLYNTLTDQADTVQGQVDKETQRVAFRIGESEDVVVETGLFNLTQQEAPALVHFGPSRVETWLLVRLEAAEQDLDPDATGNL